MRKSFLLLIAMISMVSILRSDPGDVGNLPKLLGASNEGTEFYLTFHPCWETSQKQNFVRIYISSRYATQVHLTARGVDETQTTVPNGVIQFILTPMQAQAYSKPGENAIKPLPAQVWEKLAVHITSDDPIICYGVTRFQYSSDGFLALPVSSWGKDYRVASYADPTDNTAQFLPSFSSVIAAYDDTKFSFTLGGNESTASDLLNGTELKAGETVSVTLNAGDVYLIAGKNAYNDLSGSKIHADKPVGVVSGNFCAYVPTEVSACDYLTEMEQPVYAWGYKYYIPTIKNRKKNPIIKIFPHEDETMLFKDNINFGMITQDDGFRGSGWIERRSVDGTPRPTVYSSNKTINVVLYNTGQQDDNVPSDPFQMNILPVEQFSDEVIFNTPGIKGGFGFDSNYISLIYQSTDQWKMPEDLMYGTIGIGDTLIWTKFKDVDSDPGDQIEIDSIGRHWMQKTYKLPGDGVYGIKADSKFCVYCYGQGNYDSYGFPAGGLTLDNSIQDTIPPTVIMNPVKDGIISGIIKDQGDAGTSVKAGLSVIYMVGSKSYNAELKIDKFIPGSDQTNFSVNILDKDNDAKVTLVTTDRKGNDSVMEFNYIAPLPRAELSETKIDFGNLKINSGDIVKTIDIINTSDKKTTLPIDSIVFKYRGTIFSLNSDQIIGKTLTPSESIQLNIKVNTGALGTFQDSIGIVSGGKTVYYTEVSATILNSMIRVSGDLSFGKVGKNEISGNEKITISNSGVTDLVILGITQPNTDAFIIENTGISQSNPLVLSSGAKKSFWVEFTPKAVQQYIDSVTILTDAIGNNVVHLTGTGTVNDVRDIPQNAADIEAVSKPGKISFHSETDYLVSTVQIVDLRGESVMESSPNAGINALTLNTAAFPTGVYFVKLTTDKGKFVKRVIVTK